MARSFSAWLGLLVVASFALPRPAGAYDKADFVAPKDKALVVFIQNLRDDASTTFTVVDRDLKCFAEVNGREAEVAELAPGSYTFFVSSYKTHRVDMRLVAGRTYFIRIFSYERSVMRSSDVMPVQRGTESYMQVKAWLEGARVTKASEDPCRGRSMKKQQVRRLTKQVMSADIDWDAGDEIYRARYSLLRVDGFKPEEIDWF